MAEGEFVLVEQHLVAALDHLSDWVGDHDLHSMLADAAGRREDLPALRRFAGQAEDSADRLEHALYRAVAYRAGGVAHRLEGEVDQAEARLQAALELFSALEVHWQIGRTFTELAQLELARGDRSAALSHFQRALAEFELQAAGPDIARTRAALSELGGGQPELGQ